jgi:hypothetical protein
MKKLIILIIIFAIYVNYGFSEENTIYDLINNINNEWQKTRELYIFYYSGLLNNEESQLIKDEINIYLYNISFIIRNNRVLIENNPILMRIFLINDYEINNLLNANFTNNSYEIINKIDILLEFLLLAQIIDYYETIIFNNDY